MIKHPSVFIGLLLLGGICTGCASSNGGSPEAQANTQAQGAYIGGNLTNYAAAGPGALVELLPTRLMCE
jgi:hypothetical protein